MRGLIGEKLSHGDTSLQGSYVMSAAKYCLHLYGQAVQKDCRSLGMEAPQSLERFVII